MTWAASAVVAGSLISGRSARKAGKQQAAASDRAAQLQYDAAIASGQSQERAAQIAANAQLESSRMAAEAARFRPYGITTGFGSSSFDTNKDTGTYTLDPRMAAFRDQYYAGAQNVLDQQKGFDPQEMARRVYAEQQGLLQPGRQQEDVALRQSMLSSGRVGLGVSGGAAGAGADGMLNPDQFSLDRARALADAQMAYNSREYGQAELDRLIGRGQGLLTYGTGIESLGLDSLKLGLDAGSRAGVSQGQQAQALMQGGMGAAQSMLAGGNAAAQAQLAGSRALAEGGYNSASQRIAGNLAEKQMYANLLQQGASLWGNRAPTSAGGGQVSSQASYAPGSANAQFASYF